MNELAVKQNNAVAVVSAENTALLAMIERVCVDPKADIAKLEKMLDMQERVMDRNAKQAFAADFATMQIDLPRIAENGKGHNNAKYALLEDINDSLRPVLHKYGFGVSFSIDQSDSKVTVKAKLSHRLGHFEETCLSLPLDTSGNKNAVQAAGSTISYGKRYAICALLNISTGDDVDGNLPTSEANRVVGENEIKQIRDALRVANYKEELFCKAAGIESIDQMYLNRFDGAITHIKGKAHANN